MIFGHFTCENEEVKFTHVWILGVTCGNREIEITHVSFLAILHVEMENRQLHI